MLLRLAALGQMEQVTAMVEEEANRLKEAVLARPRRGSGDPAAASLLQEEAEQIRRKYVEKEMRRYEKVAGRRETSASREEARVKAADRADGDGRQDGERATASSLPTAETSPNPSEINRIEERLIKALAALRKSISAYAESHGSPLRDGALPAIGVMLQRLSGKARLDETPAAPIPKVKERIRVTPEGVKVEATLGDEAAVDHLPWGTTWHLGARRAAYVSIEAGSPLPQEKEEGLRIELGAALRGVAGTTIEPGADPSARQQVEAWLYDADVEVLSPEQFAAMETASQTLSAYRGALLTLDAIEGLLETERRALCHGGTALEQRQADLERDKPANPDEFLKRASEMCKGELSRFLEHAAKRMEEAKAAVTEATRRIVREHIRDFSALQVADKKADSAKPGRETVHVRPERVDLVCGEVKNLLLSRCNDLGQAAQLLWHERAVSTRPEKAVRPHLVEGTLRPLLSECDLDNPGVLAALEEETFFVPLADGTTARLLEKHFDSLRDERSPALVEIEIPKMPSAKDAGYLKIIGDRIGRMPNQLMAPFAGLFVLTSLLGLGSWRGVIRNASSGAETAWFVIVTLVLLFVAFGITSHFLLKRERRAAEVVAIERAREGVANAVLQAFDRFTGAWLGVFRSHTMASLDDVLRRARKDLALFHSEVSDRWHGESLLLSQEQDVLAARRKSLEALRSGCGEARATAEGSGNQLKKLLAKWEKERERRAKRGARRGAGGGE